MSKLKKIETLEPPVLDEKTASTGTMLTTILLLIAGFLLTSTMLAHYQISFPRNTDKQSRTPASLAGLFKNRQNTDSKTNESSGLSLFPDHELISYWPRLKLSGFGKSEEESGNFAIINGKKVHPGQSVAGKVRLVEIRDHDVIVELKGETKILTIEN